MRYLIITLWIAFAAGNCCLSAVNSFTTDTGYYFATSHEGKLNAASDLLDRDTVLSIPYEFGPWEGYELEYSDENISFFRAYIDSRDGTKIYFIAVQGTVESRFHTPEVCYINDNWKVFRRGYYSINTGEKKFEARYFVADKSAWKHYLTYWFMWRDSRRLMNDGCVMLRIAVSMDGISEKEARRKTKDFIGYLIGQSIVKESIAGESPVADAVAHIQLDNPESPYFNVRTDVINWLKNQIVPNAIVPSPSNDRRNLVLSYELSKTADAYRYIFSKSSLYDNGVAVIAFTIERQFELASKIIDGIMRMGGASGELFFSFNTHNTWPSKDDSWGAMIRSGASAWAGYSIVFYLRARLLDDADAVSKSSELQGYLKYAQLIADNMLKRRVTDSQDARYGLITGGRGSYILKYSPEIDNVEEDYQPEEVKWCSIEHNIDMYYFLRDLGKVSGNEKYIKAAELMGEKIRSQCWNEKEGQFNRGQSSVKADEVMALDCASWGSLFLLSNEDRPKALISAKSAEKYLCKVNKGFGYKPYTDKPVYNNYSISKFYFPKTPRKSWEDLNLMWTEGALGISLAELRLGNTEKGKRILKEVLKYSSKSGGIYYSSLYIPHEFSSEPAVAPAGWLIINTGVLEGNKIADLFWD